MFHFYVELGSIHGIPVEQLTAGVSAAPALLRRERRWYDWDEHVNLIERFQELLGGPDRLDDAIRLGAYRRVIRPFSAVVSYLTTARGVFWAGAKWFAPSLYRHLRFDFDDLPNGAFRCGVEIPDGYRDSPTFLRLWREVMRTAPVQIGLPEVDVEMALLPRRGEYTVRMPPARNVGVRLTSWLKAVVNATDVVDELSRQQQDLREGYEALLGQFQGTLSALRRSEQTQRAMLEALPDLVVMLGADGVVQEVQGTQSHPLAERLRGLTGRSLRELPTVWPTVPAEVPGRILETSRTALAVRAPQQLEFSTRDSLHVEWRVTALDSDMLLCVARDVSQQRQLQLQLILSERMASLGTLAASVAHEINNPLTCALLQLDSADKTLLLSANSEKALNAVREAKDASERIRDIVAGLRSFSRPDEGVAPVDVRQLLDTVVRLAGHQVQHRARIEKRYAQVPFTRANEVRLGQVFLNLLVNAGQALPTAEVSKNRVELTTGVAADGRVMVEVRDNGTGISKELLPRIFDPFFTTKPVGEGYGLGLSISQRIVHDLGGSIEVDSEPGKGTTFRVLLLPSEPLPTVETAAKEEPVVAPRRKILIVDDNATVLLSLKLLLNEHDITLAKGGVEGVEKLLSDRFDVVLCDVMMPEVDGPELFRRVKEARPGVERKIIFMTGGAFTGEARSFLESSTNPCLQKPFKPAQLEEMLARVG